ncbi:MAG: hypothetical protein QXJ75_01160 [Candidatus Bathyarchaeia archaeon]
MSLEAGSYCECRGLRLIAWRYPPEGGLEKLIEEKSLYPVTILNSVNRDSLEKLSRAGIMLLKDLQTVPLEDLMQRTKISKVRLARILRELERIKPYCQG